MTKARQLADLGNVYDDGALSNRNLIINGACNVQQRNASVTTQNAYGNVDRFRLETGTTGTTTLDAGTVSSGTDPYELGFRNTARLTSTTAGTDAASDYAGIATFLEAQDVATSGWDYTSTSGKITLSFWVKSSLAGTYTARLEAYDVSPTTQNYSFSFVVAANTWTKVVKVISGSTALQFDVNANVGLGIRIWAYIGTNYTTSTNDEETWEDLDGTDQTIDQPQNWKAVSNATFEITGVQLEVGDTATPFEHRSYGDELARCQRYYCELNSSTIYGHRGSLNHLIAYCPFPVTMRATPSASDVGGTASSGTVYLNPVNRVGVRYGLISAHVDLVSALMNAEFDAEL